MIARGLRALVLGLLAGWLGFCAVMWALQRDLLFLPDRAAMDPRAAGLPASVVQETLTTPDGERIVVWWSPPQRPDRPTFLYLHGNGANLMARGRRLTRLIADGSGLMAVSWRGYGGSTGRPSEAGLMIDARTAHEATAARVAPSSIVLFGESLGTTVAVMRAAETPVRALILDSSFTSVLDLAQAIYPVIPVGLLLSDPFRADLAAARVDAPVLQIHCRADPVTPLASAERLATLFARPPERVVLDGACHPADFGAFETALRRVAGGG